MININDSDKKKFLDAERKKSEKRETTNAVFYLISYSILSQFKPIFEWNCNVITAISMKHNETEYVEDFH